MKMKIALLICLVALPIHIQAQVLPPGGGNSGGTTDSAPPPSSQPKQQSTLGNELPSFDSGSETVTWDGKMWSVTNTRMSRARLEKYLASPPADEAEDQAYRDILEEITKLLSPGRGANVPGAVALLPAAASHPIDAKLCDTLANAIFGVWLAQRNTAGLAATNHAMDNRIRNENFLNRNDRGTPLQNRILKNGETTQETRETMALARDAAKLVELEAKIKANELAIGVNITAAKLEFQAIILQFAMQRRFEHVVLACRFYRHIFSNDPSGMIEIKEGSTAEQMFADSLGTSPTISALDAFANEMIRDVDEAIVAFEYLLERGDLASASQRISEALMIGEYLPRVRRVPAAKKFAVLDFTRDGHQLVSAMEMKDYTLAAELVQKLRGLAKDFDYSKPQAAIETARTVSDMHLNKAKVAAMQGDQKSSTEALTQAAELWPTNPKLREFTNMIGSNADIKTQAAIDLDRLLSQRNYRQIYNDQGRYLASVLDDPARQEILKKVLTDVNKVNLNIAAANSQSQNSNSAGAWEIIEKAYEEFPEDPEVARLRSDLSVKASEFVGALQRARQCEDRHQTGSALAWYLKAKSQYPQSDYARQGLNRLVEQLAQNP
ncbi:hypothetical protein FEM03_10110 [Phragmitibacter flavus]|uniref:Tetratricopeptide repeat protein n=1 Tax=Phragmitibacter flavus TaxID=2576071 RepID=A0A5R8KED2_9BACT|nr:hypothetical protein [Phragmitibacter flavus]TLD70662.1 hypothetical protein FEM03_10110 [Phragmitibacter flavus]